MSTINSTINIVDRMSSPMKGIISVVRQTIDVLESVDHATDKGFDTSKLTSARIAIDKINREYEEVEEAINKTSKSQEQLNSKINSGASSGNNFVKSMLGLSAVQKILNLITGQMESAMKRMDTMTNFNRTMTAITGDANLAKASLEELKVTTKGTAYGLDVAAKAVQNFTTRGMQIGNATNEVGKWADAVAFYGDGTNESLTTVTDALGKMLSKGKVEMEQLNRITDVGINAVGIYAQATGKSTAEVQDALSKGTISSVDFITTTSNAFTEGTNGVLKIAGAAKEAGGTWATTISNMKAAVTRGLISLIDGINAGLTAAGFGTILEGVSDFGSALENTLGKVSAFATKAIIYISPFINLIRNIGTFVQNNWNVIQPILMTILGILAVYYAWQMALSVVGGILAAVEGAKTLALGISASASMMASGATLAQTAAQHGLNAALLACPITWIIIAILALIVIIIAVITWIIKAKDKTQSTMGIVLGILTTAVAFIWNLFLALLDLLLGWINYLINPFISFANFFANLFNDPIGAIIQLFSDMADCVLGILESIAKAIDKIFGSDLASAVSGWRGTLASKTEVAVKKYGNGSYEKVLDELNLSSDSLGLKRWDYSDAYGKGYAAGEKVDSALGSLKDVMGGNNSALANLANAADATAANTADTAKNTGKVASSVAATAEDLKYIRDIAEMEVINRFTTPQITVNMTNNNSISSDMDIDGITEHLTTRIEEEMYAIAEGVY